MSDPVQLVAHRGYAAKFPENTELALVAAVAAGARFIEFDVQLTLDRVPVLLHDDDFLRTAGDPSHIHDMQASDLAEINVSEPARFGAKFDGTPVCSLSRAVELLSGWPHVTAFVELKRHSLSRFGVHDVLDEVLAILDPVLKQSVVISFVEEALFESRRRCSAPVGWAVRTWDKASQQIAAELAPEFMFCNVKKLPGDPADIWRGPWQWVIYEIVDPALAIKLSASGINFIETMDVAPMRAALEHAGPQQGQLQQDQP